jgi:glycosyltransferase involved in cell wall biosynthesis
MVRLVLLSIIFRLKPLLRVFLPRWLRAWIKARIVSQPRPVVSQQDRILWQQSMERSWEQGSGMNIIGYLRSEAGVGQSSRLCAASARAAGLNTSLVDFSLFSPSRAKDSTFEELISNRNPYPFNVFHINADQTPVAYDYLGQAFFAGHYNIGYWHWELPAFPKEWLGSYDYVDEVWAPTQFVLDALAPTARKPVFRIPHGIAFRPSPNASRKQFGLPENAYLFLMMYDILSYQARKNPEAVVHAFAEAFRGSPSVTLVIKTMNVDKRCSQYAALCEILADIPNAVILDRTLSRQEIYDLESVCDSFISLHRSEGFGLGLAESMYLGKPVIGTNWSGNVDFMDATNSCPVDYQLVSLTQDHGPYKQGQIWAEADVDHAAWYMQKLVEDPAFRKRIALAGQATIQRDFSPVAVGRQYARRLEAIRRGTARVAA